MEETHGASTPRQSLPSDDSTLTPSEPPEAHHRPMPLVPLAGTERGDTHGDESRDWSDSADTTGPASSRSWDQELPRWLASLNPGRTRREYEKAVSYFFETPGVPPELEALTIDLLLAYRGSLALRATPHVDAPPPSSKSRVPQNVPSISAHAAAPDLSSGANLGLALPDIARDEDGDDDRDQGRAPRSDADMGNAGDKRLGPLAPATVNVRLTALRQFLTHCVLFGVVPDLPPERIRASLRRLRVERRRPYQVLAEPEWEDFLAAARQPAVETRRTPWGRPRRATRDADEHSTPGPEDSPREPRSGTHLTGARTAERDYALIALALATGLRAVELAALDVGDLAREWHAGQEEWWLVLPDAKTKGQRGGRTLPLASETVESLQCYLHATGRAWERAADRATPLFLSGRTGSRRLTPSSIGRVVDRVERQWQAQHAAGAALRISPHALRHSTAIALLEGNERIGRPPASVEHVRGWLGHFDIRTTQGYLAHLDARRHRRPFALAPHAPDGATSDAAGATVDEHQPPLHAPD